MVLDAMLIGGTIGPFANELCIRFIRVGASLIVFGKECMRVIA